MKDVRRHGRLLIGCCAGLLASCGVAHADTPVDRFEISEHALIEPTLPRESRERAEPVRSPESITRLEKLGLMQAGPSSVDLLRAPGTPCDTDETAGNCQARDVLAPPSGVFGLPSSNTEQLRVSESFNADGTTLTRVCWWGLYTDISTGVPVAAPASDRFAVSIYEDNNGLPGSQIGFTQFVTTGGALTGPFDTGETVTLGSGVASVYEYSVTFGVPVNLIQGNCYHIEIVNDDFGGTFAWAWLTSPQGNQEALLDDTPTDLAYNNYDRIDGVDMALCVDTGLGAICPGVAADGPACTQPDANCQLADEITPNAFVAGPTQSVADDFTVPGTPGTMVSLTEICWRGSYQREDPNNPGTFVASAPSQDGDGFTVTIYDGTDRYPGSEIASFDFFDEGFTHDVERAWTGLPIGDSAAFEYRLTTIGAGVMLTAGETYFLEISNDAVSRTWFWSAADPSEGNGRLYFDPTGASDYSPGTFAPNDTAFCVNVGLPAIPRPFPSPDNDECSTAETLTISAIPASVPGSNVGASLSVAPPIGFNLIDGPGVWYRVNNGASAQTLTASTCFPVSSPGDEADTVIHVYAGTCGDLLPVATADQDGAACAISGDLSTVSWCAEANTEYFIHVFGFSLNEGLFSVAVTGDNTACTPTETGTPLCDLGPTGFEVLESGLPGLAGEMCGDLSNDQCFQPIVLQTGQVLSGTLFAENNTRDRDFIVVQGLGGSAVAPVNMLVTVLSEMPIVLTFGDIGTCPGNLLLAEVGACGALQTTVPGVDQDLQTFGVFPGTFIVDGTTATLLGFNGAPCGSGWNNYIFAIDDADATGACCLPDDSCVVAAEGECAIAGGTWLGLGVTCGTRRCDEDEACCLSSGTCVVQNPQECLDGGGTPQGVADCTGVTCEIPEACCTGNVCTLVTPTDCTTGGGTPQGASTTCTPDPCAAVLGACCVGGVCTETDLTTCNGQGGTFLLGATCVIAGEPGTVCCEADSNRDGIIAVGDILDFLAFWSAQDPRGDFSGDGLFAVGDILDFLSAWAAGCD